MHSELKNRQHKRGKRAVRVRKNLRGSSEKPRLTVFKSNRHIFAQIIDDEAGKTIVSLGTQAKELKGNESIGKSKAGAQLLGKILAEKAAGAQITHVVFDRGRYKFHGVIAELANAAREAGLQF